jgi:hypothetical protein
MTEYTLDDFDACDLNPDAIEESDAPDCYICFAANAGVIDIVRDNTEYFICPECAGKLYAREMVFLTPETEEAA